MTVKVDSMGANASSPSRPGGVSGEPDYLRNRTGRAVSARLVECQADANSPGRHGRPGQDRDHSPQRIRLSPQRIRLSPQGIRPGPVAPQLLPAGRGASREALRRAPLGEAVGVPWRWAGAVERHQALIVCLSRCGGGREERELLGAAVHISGNLENTPLNAPLTLMWHPANLPLRDRLRTRRGYACHVSN